MTRSPMLVCLALLWGCGGAAEAPEATVAQNRSMEADEERAEYPKTAMPASAAPPAPMEAPGGGFGLSGAGEGGGGLGGLGARGGGYGAKAKGAPERKPSVDDAEGERAETPSRAWFPETFLFAPSIVTDHNGEATLSARVPDRLTTWRVLALAHSRNGGLGGDVHSFLGTLPVYVDPVVPPLLRVGDQLRLPLQVVNTTAAPVSGTLSLSGGGAGTVGGQGAVTVPAYGSKVVWAALHAERSGVLALRAALSGADSVVREIPVVPTGQKITQSRGGTLAAPREFELVGADGLDAATASLYVFPGARSILDGELAAAGGRASSGYALLLAGQGPALLQKLGVSVVAGGPDPEARQRAEDLRTLGLLAMQAAIRESRVPDLAVSVALLEGAASNPDNAVAARLTDRLVLALAQEQRPDGSFGGGAGWTLQRVMVATAEAARALQAAAALPHADPAAAQRHKLAAERARLLASGFVERNFARVQDPYTAAALLAAHLLSGERATQAEARVKEAITQKPDGAAVLPVEAGVVRGDGRIPGALESTALAILALESGEPALRADLGAAIVGGWRPGAGWGDGAADALCLRAVLALFDAPLPAEVTLTLSRDGVPLQTRTVKQAEMNEVLLLSAPATGSEGPHTYTVSATPPVAGLGFAFNLDGYVPWVPQSRSDGIEVKATLPANLVVGQKAQVTLSISAPAGRPLKVVHQLPAGVVGEDGGLAGILSGAAVTVKEGEVDVSIEALDPGEVWTGSYTVVPTLAGDLSSGPLRVSYADRPDVGALLPPERWVVR